MTMFPAYIIGIVIGIAASYTFYVYKKDIPSRLKFDIQKKEIEQQQNENNMLNSLVNKLYKKIETLENELKEYKK